MPASSSSSAPLIKGYLPVRLRLPRQTQLLRRGESDEETTEDTFLFVREHQGKTTTDDSESSSSNRGTTLFVANAPVVPGVSTKLLLKSIFGRFADVTRVTAVQNPRAAASTVAAAGMNEGGLAAASHDSMATTTTTSLSDASSLPAWSDKQALFQPTFLPPILSATEGKYAHVVFSTAKEMKKAKKALEDLMSKSNSGNNGSRKRSKGRKKQHQGDGPQQQEHALILDKLELQTLSDESLRQREEAIQKAFDDTTDDEDSDDIDDDTNNIEDTKDSNNKTRELSGVLAVAQRYRESCKFLKSRSKLMEECNAVMQAYEDAEEAKRLAQEAAKAQPDEDGFITVSYSNAVGSKIDLEQSATATTPSRRKGNKRSRRKKEAIGSGELKDFYRFQKAENRKRTMEDLRRKFEEDVRKVKRLKEEKEYRPF